MNEWHCLPCLTRTWDNELAWSPLICLVVSIVVERVTAMTTVSKTMTNPLLITSARKCINIQFASIQGISYPWKKIWVNISRAFILTYNKRLFLCVSVGTQLSLMATYCEIPQKCKQYRQSKSMQWYTKLHPMLPVYRSPGSQMIDLRWLEMAYILAINRPGRLNI